MVTTIVHFMGHFDYVGRFWKEPSRLLECKKTITIERNNVRYMKKYERFEKRTSRLVAHLPSCIGEVNIGDAVRIMECRPLSKTISFCVIENNGGGQS